MNRQGKVDLATREIVEVPATFPRPGILAGRSEADVAAILANPAGFFNEAYEAEQYSHDEPLMVQVTAKDRDGKETVQDVVAGTRAIMTTKQFDPCPEDLRGFGWFEIGAPPALQPGEKLGEPDFEVDPIEPVIHDVTPVIKPTAKAKAAAYDQIEARLVDQVAAGAARARRSIYSPDPSKAAIHSRKATQAAAVIAAGSADPVEHDYIVEEAALRGLDAVDFAGVVMAKVKAVAAAGKAIELAQQTAEIDIGQAKGNLAAMEAAAAVDWSAIGGD